MKELSEVISSYEMNNIVKQFTRLKDHCYLDNAGAALYPESLIKAVSDDFTTNIYMNPHSDIRSQECIDDVRNLILRHFHTNASEYSVVFTSGATQSLRLVAESFRFSPKNERGAFVHLCDNHTSVLGLRELVKLDAVEIFPIPHDNFIETLTSDDISDDSGQEKTSNALLVYPAQNNFNGHKYPIDRMDDIRRGCLDKFVNRNGEKKKYDWHILLDAASFVSTSNLDLTVVKPDFVCLSFYKIFGYPTGLGALLVKNDSIPVLNEKKYYGGGTVDTVLNSDTFFARKKDLSEGFEDGTISFLSIMALKHCFNALNKLIPKAVNNNAMETISLHTFHLAKEFYNRLEDLKHQNGRKAIVFYMDTDFTDIKKQGGIVTFNIIREDGSFVGYNEFESKSVTRKISVRTGCFCNSGSCQRHFQLSNKEIRDRYEAGHKCGGETDLIDGVPTGAVRVSFGYYNTYADVDNIMNMITECYVTPKIMSEKALPKGFVRPHMITQIPCKGTTKQNYIDPPKKFTKTLKEIIIYPIEHCGPYTIKSNWRLGSEGLEYNKTWKIITTNNTVLNENSKRLLSKICPEFDLNYNNLILHYPGTSSICIPLEEYIVYSSICVDEETIEHDCGDKIATWISNVANCPNLRLVKIIRNVSRKSNPFESLSKMIIMTNEYHFMDHTFDYKSIKANLVVDMPPESFTGDWDKIVIGNHEFKVEGYYSQSLKINTECNSEIALNQPKICSKDLVLAVYLSYLGSLNGCYKNLEINSQVQPLLRNQQRSEVEDRKLNNDNIIFSKESKTLKTKINNLLFNRQRKFEVTAL
ncbi:molybdenum cofactor sulfurase-like [Aricia agestis]|uniref:molybdenum cofactor sulfurase-like n=1 Tax=Aricia agestis TaxID=91739 RepID=UPI001C204FCF|nr:molybdenum cofactor sulfurase-like [Aricia agestis]